MATLADLVVNIEASTLQLRRELQRADQSINRFAGTTNRQLRTIDHRFSRVTTAARSFGAAIIGLGLIQGARRVTAYADKFTQLQNQLRLVTTSTQNLAVVTDDLRSIAGQTGQSLDTTITLFARMTRATQTLNVSQGEVLDITRSLGQAIVISGASAQEASAALRQLSQGLAAGALRGEEFNSISEQMPVLLTAISRQTGIARGDLREFAAEGGITADIVIRAVQGMADEWNSQFESMDRTVSQATTHLGNEILVLIGSTNKAASGTSTLATAIDELANAVARLNQTQFPEWLQTILAIEASAWQARIDAITGLADAIEGLAGSIQAGASGLGSLQRMNEMIESDVLRFQQLAENMRQAQEEAAQGPLAIDIFGGQSRPAPRPELRPQDVVAKFEAEASREAARALEERARAIEDYERAVLDLNRTRSSTIVDLRRENEETRRIIQAQRQGEAAVRAVNTQIEIENTLLELGLSARSAQGQAIAREIEQRHKLLEQMQETAEEQRQQSEFEREQERLAERRADLLTEPFRNALESIQRSFADTFENIFSGGVNSFKDLAGEIKSIFIRLAAEIAALMVIRPVLGGVAGAAGIGGFASPALAGFGGFGAPLFGGEIEAGTGAVGGGISLGGGAGILGAGLGLAMINRQIGGALGGLTGSKRSGRRGGLIGTALLGPLGGFIGGPLGGLFGGEPSNQEQGVILRGDRFVSEFGATGDKFNAELRQSVDAIGQSIQGFVSGIESLTGGTFAERIQVAVGQRDPSRIRIGPGSIFDDGTRRGPTGDPQAALRIALEEIAKNFEDLSARQARVLRRSIQLRGADVQAILGDIQFVQAFEDAANQMSAVEKQIREINRRFDELRRTAEELGLATGLLDRAERQALRGLIEQRRNAIDALQQQAANFFSGILDPLRRFQAETERAAVGPAQQFQLLREQFENIAAAARGGDLAAIQRLPEIGRTLIEAAGEFGASPLLASVSQQVGSVITDVIGEVEQQQNRALRGVSSSIDRSIRAQTDTFVEEIRGLRDEIRTLRREVRKTAA